MTEIFTNEYNTEIVSNFDFSICHDETSILKGIFKPELLHKDEFFIHQGRCQHGLVTLFMAHSVLLVLLKTVMTLRSYFIPRDLSCFSYAAVCSKKGVVFSIQALEDSEILTASMVDLEPALLADITLGTLLK
jgi:hypothetical protein